MKMTYARILQSISAMSFHQRLAAGINLELLCNISTNKYTKYLGLKLSPRSKKRILDHCLFVCKWFNWLIDHDCGLRYLKFTPTTQPHNLSNNKYALGLFRKVSHCSKHLNNLSTEINTHIRNIESFKDSKEKTTLVELVTNIYFSA